jgi:sugar phosphate isomerase/epimerase
MNNNTSPTERNQPIMWTLSGFADEISDDFTEQCQVAAGLGLQFIEVRSAWGINILDLDAQQLATVRQTLADHGLAVSSIGSPIGKIPIDEDFEPHLQRARHAGEVANLLGAGFIRIFSFFIRDGSDPDDHRDEVLRRMTALAEVATDAGVIMLHENEKEIYGDIPRRCLDIVTSVDSPNLRLAWDPANFVQVGVRPFTEGYADLRPHVAYVQIKTPRWWSRVPAMASWSKPSERYGLTASTGSSPSSRIWASTPRSARCPALSCSPRPGRPSPTF